MAERRPSKPGARRRPEQTLEDLRPLLIGPEQGRIQRIEERLDHVGELVADALPAAVAESRKKGDELGYALDPLVDQSMRRAMSKDPGAFGEVLAPTLGPAIRRAVALVMRAALQRLEVALERTLTVQSLRWRLEARRTGRPFAEVALMRTLVYRVEQIYLIHRETGLLLEHVTADEGPAQDPDQISAMLSALETFTHEAFREEARLERFRVGELAGWVEHGPSAILVAIVRGTAPEGYERTLREALDRTQVEQARALAEFQGDTASFASTRELLSDCLSEHHEMPRRFSRRAIGTLLVALLALAIALAGYRSWREERRFEAMLSALRSEPGLVVTSAARHAFAGLRDPLAEDPAAVLRRSGIDPGRTSLRFEPFYSLDPAMVQRRARRLLRPPDAVWLSYRDGLVVARGVAPRRWIDQARVAAALLPGVTALDDRHLVEQEALDHATAEARALDGIELYFAMGSTRLSADQRARFEEVAAAEQRLVAEARQLHRAVHVEVSGYTDPSGEPAGNERLALGRAEGVAAELRERGIAGVDARGEGVRAGVAPGRARSVILRVELREAAEE